MTLPHERPTFRDLLARDDGDGWECPRCGCRDWRVVDSRQFGDVRKRVRACRHCHQTIRTNEVIAEPEHHVIPLARPNDSTGSLREFGVIAEDVQHDDADDGRRSDRTKRARA